MISNVFPKFEMNWSKNKDSNPKFHFFLNSAVKQIPTIFMNMSIIGVNYRQRFWNNFTNDSILRIVKSLLTRISHEYHFEHIIVVLRMSFRGWRLRGCHVVWLGELPNITLFSSSTCDGVKEDLGDMCCEILKWASLGNENLWNIQSFQKFLWRMFEECCLVIQ